MGAADAAGAADSAGSVGAAGGAGGIPEAIDGAVGDQEAERVDEILSGAAGSGFRSSAWRGPPAPSAAPMAKDSAAEPSAQEVFLSAFASKAPSPVLEHISRTLT